MKDRLGGTVNDVVLATVAGALRRFLELRRLDVDRLRIRANVPVSLRSRDERGTLGNRIALLMAELPVDEPDPRRAPRPRARDDGAPQVVAAGARRRGARGRLGVDQRHAALARGARAPRAAGPTTWW